MKAELYVKIKKDLSQILLIFRMQVFQPGYSQHLDNEENNVFCKFSKIKLIAQLPD